MLYERLNTWNFLIKSYFWLCVCLYLKYVLKGNRENDRPMTCNELPWYFKLLTKHYKCEGECLVNVGTRTVGRYGGWHAIRMNQYNSTQQMTAQKFHKMSQKCKYNWISLLYLESPLKMHSNKYKHAWYRYRYWNLKTWNQKSISHNKTN